MSTSINQFRKYIPEFLKYSLSQQSMTIAEMEEKKHKSIPNDQSQSKYENMPVWHSRIDLIENLAQELQISPEYWGSQRTSADFYNTIDQEISKLRKKKIIVDWNSSKRTGIIRLTDTNQTFSKPTVSLDESQESVLVDSADQNDPKKIFVSILRKGRKDNTYKFALARALLEYCKETSYDDNDAYRVIPYEYLADKFLKYYWYQECKFRIKQDFKIKSTPKVIQAIRKVFNDSTPPDFDLVDEEQKDLAKRIILKDIFGNAKSKTSLVVPKFQKIVEGRYSNLTKVFYDYDDTAKKITLHPAAFRFFKDNNSLLSLAVLAEWAKFLEKTNGSLPKLVAKIEQENPKRKPLSAYRDAYLEHTNHCFYCRDKLETGYIHVDHFVPWSYIFADDAWNLVLACQDCNLKKSGSLPTQNWKNYLVDRNKKYRDQIPLLNESIELIDTRLGWEREIDNHYKTCNEYGFNIIKMP